jgi:ribosomal protein S14
VLNCFLGYPTIFQQCVEPPALPKNTQSQIIDLEQFLKSDLLGKARFRLLCSRLSTRPGLLEDLDVRRFFFREVAEELDSA